MQLLIFDFLVMRVIKFFLETELLSIVSKRIRFNFGPVIFLNAIAMHFLLFYRDKAAKKLSLVRGVTYTTDD